MKTIKYEAPSNEPKTQNDGKIASYEHKRYFETIADICKIDGLRVQNNSDLLNDVDSRFRKICAANHRDDLIIFLGDRLVELMELFNKGTKMDGVQCNHCAALIVGVFPDMNIADFYSFIWAFRSGRFRSHEIPFDKLFNHIDENVVMERLKAFLVVRDRVLQAERNAAENRASLQSGPRVTGVRQVEDAPITETPAVHISETLKALGFIPE